MQVRLSSGNYDLIASGEAFLFDPFADLTIHVDENDKSLIRLVLKFTEDPSGEHDIKSDIINDSLVINCSNFSGTDTGLKLPVHIADIDGNEIYLMFSSTCHGGKKNMTRSIKYTLFREK